MPKTGTFYDIDPDNWQGYVSIPVDAAGYRTDRLGYKPKRASKPAPADDGVDYTPFWEAMLDLVNAWSRYQAVKKIEINATYAETEHKVAGVVGEYWAGSPKKLRETVEQRSGKVEMELKRSELMCSRFRVDPVTREWLHDHLLDGGDYASYRGKINRRKKKNAPAKSLKVL